MVEDRAFAGIDVGTTTTKAVIVNANGEVLGSFVRRSGTDLASAATAAFEEAITRAGIARDKIVVDPGIGFGKTLEHNLALLSGLSLLHGLGLPVLVGASRKRFVGTISGVEAARERVAGSIGGDRSVPVFALWELETVHHNLGEVASRLLHFLPAAGHRPLERHVPNPRVGIRCVQSDRELTHDRRGERTSGREVW